MAPSRSQRISTAIAGVAVVGVAAVVLVSRITGPPSSNPHAKVLADHTPVNSSNQQWKRIEYHGVTVDIPRNWIPLDTGNCEFAHERWALASSDPCEYDGGLIFYGATTADPATGPGVTAIPPGGGEPAWGGWVGATGTDWDVYASDDDRDVVRRILGSVRP